VDTVEDTATGAGAATAAVTAIVTGTIGAAGTDATGGNC
jgi:hypothetical protein